MSKSDVAKIVNRIKKKEHKLDVKLQAIEALATLSQSLSSKVQSKIANNKTAILQELCSSIGEKIENQSFSEVITALEKQTKLLKDESGIKIAEGVTKLIKEVGELQNKDYFDQKEFNLTFSGGIKRIVETLTDDEEFPNDTFYFRNNDGSIKEVVEDYDKFTLRHLWKYNGKNNLAHVKTIKKEKK